jgi:hypothetical protein
MLLRIAIYCMQMHMKQIEQTKTTHDAPSAEQNAVALLCFKLCTVAQQLLVCSRIKLVAHVDV